MSPFGHKTKATTEGFCQQFYDSQVFNVAIAGRDMSNTYWDTVFRSIVEADESFAGTDKSVFIREMNAIRLELFSLAWSHKFKKEKYTIPQSVFTRQYLKQNGKLELWDIMGEYNRAIADSVTLTAKGERMRDRRVDKVNLARLDMWKKWVEVNVKDKENLTEEEDVAAKSFTRVANRIGADVSRNDSILVKRLGARLADRLGCSTNLSNEALFRLAAVIYGLYQGAMEDIKSISLQR
jgi:hypothetical protein